MPIRMTQAEFSKHQKRIKGETKASQTNERNRCEVDISTPRLYEITPVTKPRQTQKDKWAKRPAVVRYREFADKARELGIYLTDGDTHVIFMVPMPDSWSKEKREQMAGKPHQQTPDADNLLKALMDAIRKEDSGIWRILPEKRWAESGGILIKPLKLIA